MTLPKMKSLELRLWVAGLVVVMRGLLVGGTRVLARVSVDATTPLVTSFVGGDIFKTGPSTVIAGCGEAVSV